MNNAQLVIDEVKKAVKGKDDCIIKAFAAFLAGGHILLEDVPGVGKTTLAVAFSRAMALVNHRVQFTPDVLPADILGFSMYQKQTGEFVYHEGAVMCNLFLADEINRTESLQNTVCAIGGYGGGKCHCGWNKQEGPGAVYSDGHSKSKGQRRYTAVAGVTA